MVEVNQGPESTLVVEFWKYENANDVDVWYNELIVGYHPQYLTSSQVLKFYPYSDGAVAYAYFIDLNVGKVAVSYANYVVEEADEYYAVPIPNWISEDTVIYIVAMDLTNNNPDPSFRTRLYKMLVPAQAGDVINLVTDNGVKVQYIGVNPAIGFIYNGKPVIVAHSIAPELVAALGIAAGILTGGTAGIAIVALSAGGYFASKIYSSHVEEEVSRNYADAAKTLAEAQKEVVSDVLNSCPLDHFTECTRLVRAVTTSNTTYTSAVATVAETGMNVSETPNKSDDSIVTKLEEIGEIVKYIIPLVGVMVVVMKLGILKSIFDSIKDMFKR